MLSKTRRSPLSKRKKTIPATDEGGAAATEHTDSPQPAEPAEEEYGLAAVEPAEEQYGLAAVEPADAGQEETGLVEPAEPSAEDVRVDRLQQELQETQDLLRRKHAEFENYRKRIEREQKEFVSYATSELVLEILPVLDNLERALESTQGGESDSEKQIREGVAIVYRQFSDALKKAGLREVNALGEDFDPHVHEAVARVETAEHREGEILDVLQKGYVLKERLLRPAMVRVGHNPSVNEENNDTASPEEVRAGDESSESDA